MPNHAKQSGALSSIVARNGVAVGVLLSALTWMLSRIIVALRWPSARNPFAWNPRTWSHWDTKNYLTISHVGRTFGACGTKAFPFPFYYHVTWCGTAAWLPGYPFVIQLLHSIGIGSSSAGLLVANLAFFIAIVVAWFGWARTLPFWRALVVLLFFALFPGAVYNFALFPLSLTLALLAGGLIAASKQRFLVMALLLGAANLCYPSVWFASLGIAAGLIVLARHEGVVTMFKRGLWGLASFLSVAVLLIHDQIAFGHFNAFFTLESQAKPSSTIVPGIPSKYLHSLHRSGVNLLIAQMVLALALIALAAGVTWFDSKRGTASTIDVLTSFAGLAVGIGLLFSLSGGSWNRSIVIAAPSVLCLRRLPIPLLLVLTILTGILTSIVSLDLFNGTVI